MDDWWNSHMTSATSPEPAAHANGRAGEPRWPMAAAVLATGALRFLLPVQLKDDFSSWAILILLVVLLVALIIGDPGRIDRQRLWLRVLTDVMIAVITFVNATAAVRLTIAIIDTDPFTENAKVLLASGTAVWLTNVIVFALWYWDLDSGGAAARASRTGRSPAFLFPEMKNRDRVEDGWYPMFVDYLYLSFSTAAAFSATDISPLRKWAKVVMMSEASISLVVAILVVARAVNILK